MQTEKKYCDVMMVDSSLCHHAFPAASEAVLQWIIFRLSCRSALQQKFKGMQFDGHYFNSMRYLFLKKMGRCLAHAFN
jgi:hypothetical protein